MAAYISIVSTTETTIKVKMAGLDTSYSYSDRVCSWYLDGKYKGQSTLSAGVSSGGTYTFTGLKAGTEYEISVSITAPSWSYTVEKETTAETDAATIDIDYWSWTSSNGSATASQTKKAYTAVDSNGKLSDFSYKVWNDMVDKVDEILDAMGYSWSSYYCSKSNTKMSSSDKELTAERFNSLRYNIGSHYGTGIQEVDTGDIVYGDYFITLADKINDWIDRGY